MKNKKMTILIFGLLGLSVLSQKLISSGKRTEELVRQFGETLQARKELLERRRLERLERESQDLAANSGPSVKERAKQFEKRADEKSVSPSLEELKKAAEERKRAQEEEILQGMALQHNKFPFLNELYSVKGLLKQAYADDSGLRKGSVVVADVLNKLPNHIEFYKNHTRMEDMLRSEDNLKKLFQENGQLKDMKAVNLARNILDILMNLDRDSKQLVLQKISFTDDSIGV